MSRIEVVSAELLERELNSRRFLDGLEKTIEIANELRPITNGKRHEKENPAKPLYRCGFAYFTPGNSGLDFDLSKFAYKCEVRGEK